MAGNGNEKLNLKIDFYEKMKKAENPPDHFEEKDVVEVWLSAVLLAEALVEITSPRTKEGIWARLQVINCLVEAGKIDEAKEALKRFIREKKK